jgi:hypothetical protein
VVKSETARRSGCVGGLTASPPVPSILANVLAHLDTREAEKGAALARSIFRLVLPSLFGALSRMLKRADRFCVVSTCPPLRC